VKSCLELLEYILEQRLRHTVISDCNTSSREALQGDGNIEQVLPAFDWGCALLLHAK